jgi:hypothetical protein
MLVTHPLNLLMNVQVYCMLASKDTEYLSLWKVSERIIQTQIPPPTLLTLTKLVLIDSGKAEALTYCLESQFSELKVRRKRCDDQEGDASIRVCSCKWTAVKHPRSEPRGHHMSRSWHGPKPKPCICNFGSAVTFSSVLLRHKIITQT